MTKHSFPSPAQSAPGQYAHCSDPAVRAVVEDAGELWADAGVGYIPDGVNEWLDLGLAELGWSRQRVDTMRERLLADVRVARDLARQRTVGRRIETARAAAAARPMPDEPAQSREEIRARLAELRAVAEVRKAAAAVVAAERQRREDARTAAGERQRERDAAAAERQREREVAAASLRALEAQEAQERARLEAERVEAARARAEREAELAAAAAAQGEKDAQERDRREGELAEAARARAERAAEETAERWRKRPAPQPAPLPYGVSHAGAELLAMEWMRHLGVLDAEVTRASGDGGIDVVSDGFVAQVKNYAGSVSVQEVRELYGVATAEGKRSLLFTSGKVTAEAMTFANRVGVAVVRYDAEGAQLFGLNDIAARAITHSIPEAWDQRPQLSGS